MDDWFSLLKTGCEFSPRAFKKLRDDGFEVIPGPFESGELSQICAKYDSLVESAPPDDKRVGSTTTRVNGLWNRESAFDALYIYQPLLEACSHVIGKPFKLSSFHTRTLRPHSPSQGLHVDFKPDEERFPLLGFIFMVDEFREDNGATGFVPGSHRWSTSPVNSSGEALAGFEHQIQPACGPAGSLIVFNGSIWHGHTANLSAMPRRSIQGAFIPRDAQAAIDFKSCLKTETLARISPLAKYLLDI